MYDILNLMNPYSIYIHFPFCSHRCSYCDFNTYIGRGEYIPMYVDAICREAELIARSIKQCITVHTIYFGGGTPSLLGIKSAEMVLEALCKYFFIKPELEVTLEANPGTVDITYLRGLRRIGVNRLSFGMQSANSEDLRLLGRQHSYDDVIQCVEQSRKVGYRNVNLDLIYGIPYQTLESWQISLESALRLQPDHLSLYSLKLEPGTSLYSDIADGKISKPEEDMIADMYEWAMDRLETAGFSQYEISNWASKDMHGEKMECKHNLQYWRNLPYIGLGSGAHGYAWGYRMENVKDIDLYIKGCQEAGVRDFPFGPATANILEINRASEIQETMIVGLRLTEEGIDKVKFNKRFGKTLKEIYGDAISKLRKHGLLEWVGTDGDRLRLTRKGRLLGNQVFMQFIDIKVF